MDLPAYLEALADRIADRIGDRIADRLVNLAPRELRPAEYLSTEQVAAIAGLAPVTLRTWRMSGKGPAFVKVGARVRYSRADLDAWLSARGGAA